MSNFKKIKDIKQLKKKASESPIEVFILLNFGLRSSKSISYNPEDDTWNIYNYIDDTEQTLKTGELAENTNIIKALDNGALYQY